MKNYLLLFLMFLSAIGLRAEGFKLDSTDPTAGETFDGIDYDYVNFKFNQSMTIGKAYIVLADKTKIEIGGENLDISNAYYHQCRCIILDMLKELRNSGKLAMGDAFEVRLEDVKSETTSELLSPDGVASVSLIAGRIVLGDVVDITPTNHSVLKPFYKEDGTEGFTVFTFSDVVTAEAAKFVYGNVESANYGTIDLPTPVCSEKTVTVDYRGIDMSASKISGNTEITLQLTGVKTTDGIKTAGNVPGSAGTYTVVYTIKAQSGTTVVPLFTPGVGSNIDKAKKIECWLNEKVLFNAVRLTYLLGGGETVFEFPANQLEIKEDPEDKDAMSVFIPVGDLAFGAGDVKVEFVNATDLEGYKVTIAGTFISAGKTAEAKYVSVNPTPGTLSEYPSTFSFLFGDVVTVDGGASKIINNGEELNLNGSGISVVAADNNKNVVTLSSRGSFYGDFVFVLKVTDASGNAVTYGETDGFVTIGYSVYNFDCTAIEPAEGEVESLKSFALTFKNNIDESDFIGGINPANKAKLYDAQNNETEATIAVAEGDSPTQIVVTLPNEVATSGTYKLVIPAATVFNSLFVSDAEDFGIMGGAFYNPDLTYQYTIRTSGIETVESAGLSGVVEVYSLQGILLRKADISVALKGLDKGIYIVNGKKIVVE